MSFSEDDFKLPPAWRPNPGDIVEGTVERIEQLQSEFGPYYGVVLALDGDRAVSVSSGGGAPEMRQVSAVTLHCFHAVLQSEMARANVQAGDEIGVLFEGKVQGGKNAYARYAVRKRGGVQQPIRWDQQGLPPVESDIPADARGLRAADLQAPLRFNQPDVNRPVDADVVDDEVPF